MSVSLYCYLEVKDKKGKWHLVKTFGNKKFDDSPKDENEQEVSVGGEEYRTTNEWSPGLAWRDELYHGVYHGEFGTKGLPGDISPELFELIEGERLSALENWKKSKEEGKIWGSESWYEQENYHGRYAYAILKDMFAICEEKEKEWRKTTIDRIKKLREDGITKKLDWIIEKLSNPEKKQKAINEEKEEGDYEETLNYYLDEWLWEVISLYRETWMLKDLAEAYTGDDWFDSKNVRVIYHTY